MTEGEGPSSEQAGGSTPPPGLGVPPLGAPSASPGGAGSPGSPGTPPPGQAKPEIVEGYLPHLDPGGLQQPEPKRGFRMTASRTVLLVIIVLVVSGAIATQVRHARATPNDKLACSATLNALSNPTTGMPAMLHDLDFVNDNTLLGARGALQTHIAQQNLEGIGQDLNTVIHRCNQISDEFKSGFKTYCDLHPGYCRQTFHIGPF